MAGGAAFEQVSFESILEKAKGTLSAPQLTRVNELESEISAAGTGEKIKLYGQLGETWATTGNVLVGGKYYAEAAAVSGKKEDYEKAADFLYFGFPTTTDSMARVFGAQQAIEVFRNLYAIDSSRTDYLIREAVCYIEGLGNVMQGVTILKKVEAKEPDNPEMNLILGRLAVVSGQFDKAIARLEKLTQLDATNAEAYYHLAEAYQAVGKNEEAVKSLEACRRLVNDPAFAAQIDQYIQQIKKP